jgi:hypothetical protein
MIKKGDEFKTIGPPIYSSDNVQSRPPIAKNETIYFCKGDDLG